MKREKWDALEEDVGLRHGRNRGVAAPESRVPGRENRVLRNQIDRRILLTDPERRILAEKAVALGKLMADTVTIVKPETILRWHRGWWRKSSTDRSTER